MKWFIVRHGEIPANVKKIYSGWSDEELTQRGVQQAEEAGKLFSKFEIDAVYCSPLKRTMQTAEIICKDSGLTPISNDNLTELRMGPWEGLSEEEVASYYPEEWKLWNTHPDELILPGRETLKQLQQRALKGLISIEEECGKDKSVLVVSHVAVIRVIFLYSESRSLSEYKKIHVENGRVYSLKSLNLEGGK